MLKRTFTASEVFPVGRVPSPSIPPVVAPPAPSPGSGSQPEDADEDRREQRRMMRFQIVLILMAVLLGGFIFKVVGNAMSQGQKAIAAHQQQAPR